MSISIQLNTTARGLFFNKNIYTIYKYETIFATNPHLGPGFFLQHCDTLASLRSLIYLLVAHDLFFVTHAVFC